MAKMVQIQSSITIKVTCGLQNNDVTNPDAHIPDRLKISAEWPKYSVLIRAGAHNYPAEIANWASVKALAKDKILTIGATSEIEDLSEEESKNVTIVNDANAAFKEEEKPIRRTRRSLAELATDENN